MTLDTPYAPVWRADDADQQTVLDVLTEAFMNDAVGYRLFPKAAERGRFQSHFYRPLLAHPTGKAYLAGRREGASVWLTPAAGQTPHEEQPDAPESDPNLLAHWLLPRNAARAADLVFRPLARGFFPPVQGWRAHMMPGTASTSTDDAGSEVV
ncbi:hypothetical protein ACFLIM_47905 [Nonomuraea sp. M3C6]|uniref:Uncharacterized protein n=1 Tax=Nonomuraea marmarensis TaxID=3351344 RepID=A0ABW7AU02_9ACTN